MIKPNQTGGATRVNSRVHRTENRQHILPAPRAAETVLRPAPEDLSTWLRETDAAKRLKISERQLRRMAEAGKLDRRNRRVDGRRPEPVYSPEDIERLAIEKPFAQVQQLDGDGNPQLHPVIAQSLTLLERITGPMFSQNQQSLERMAQVLEKSLSAAPVAKPWMTLIEASAYVGLTAGFLRRLVRSGQLPSLRDREGTKVRKIDLDNLDPVRINDQIGRKAEAGA